MSEMGGSVMHLTPVQNQLLEAVKERGQVRSLLNLTTDLCVNYSHAWNCVSHLERHHMIVVTRNPGLPLVLEPPQNAEDGGEHE